MTIALEVKSLSKNFGGLKAIDDMSFSLDDGGFTALIGPNGAGKTTCFNLLSGGTGTVSRWHAIARTKYHQHANAPSGAPRDGPNISNCGDIPFHDCPGKH